MSAQVQHLRDEGTAVVALVTDYRGRCATVKLFADASGMVIDGPRWAVKMDKGQQRRALREAAIESRERGGASVEIDA